MRSPLHPVVFLASSFLAPLAAQCVPIAGSGCTGAGTPNCLTAPQVNTQLGHNFIAPCGTREGNWTVIGACLANAVPIPSPIVCSGPCGLVVDMTLVIRSFSVSIPIPNDPGLIGRSFCTQGFAICPGQCFTLTQGLRVTILP